MLKMHLKEWSWIDWGLLLVILICIVIMIFFPPKTEYCKINRLTGETQCSENISDFNSPFKVWIEGGALEDYNNQTTNIIYIYNGSK